MDAQRIGDDPVSGLSGNVQSLKDFAAKLRELPTVVAQKVAAAAAPALTEAARATFEAGEDAFGIAWVPKADGTRATLRKSDTLFDGTFYVATGTKLRIKLAKPEYRYVIGKRPIFPRQGDPLPTAYVEALKSATAEVCKAELGR